MQRFEIIGYRLDSRLLYVDIAYRDSAANLRALETRLADVHAQTGAKPSLLGSDDAQRNAFNALLTHVLRFADEGHFGAGIPEKERHKQLRGLAKSVNGQLGAILDRHRHRRVATVSFKKTDDPDGLLKLLRRTIEA